MVSFQGDKPTAKDSKAVHLMPAPKIQPLRSGVVSHGDPSVLLHVKGVGIRILRHQRSSDA